MTDLTAASETATVMVDLGARSYPIYIGAGVLGLREPAAAMRRRAPGRVCLVTHPTLRANYAEPLAESLRDEGADVRVITVPAGERFKTLSRVASLYRTFLDCGLDRHGLAVAVGGGVLGDVVGFAAASYLRGISFAQAPTTLLAQVDASVGGKTGVDLPEGKNLVGAFHQPVCVAADTIALNTLSSREMRSGLAEVIKYGIIADDALLTYIETNLASISRREADAIRHIVVRSCAIKAQIVGADETEQGRRAILNFGHTVGHALESVTGYRRFKHGEAIAIGMVTAAIAGERTGAGSEALTRRIRTVLHAARLPTAFPEDIDPRSMLPAIHKDKKNRLGKLRMVFVREAGDAFVSEIEERVLIDAIAQHRRL